MTLLPAPLKRGVGVVQRYTLMKVKDGRLAALVPIAAADDVEAVEAARNSNPEGYCELWTGERLVAFIEHESGC
jgi:hypothetical protein